MRSKEEAEKVAEQGATANDSTKSSIVSNVAVNVLLAGSMNKIWDLVEGL